MRGILLLGALLPATTTADDGGSVGLPNRVTLERRSARQDHGAWVVDYRLRNETPTGLVVTPAEIEVKAEGWVSNSRVSGHSVPRKVAVAIRPAEKAAAEGDVIAAPDDAKRCRERVSLAVWSDDREPEPAAKPADALAPISLAPGASGLVRLRFAHQHVVHGEYDPLLGVRTVSFRIGEETFRDEVPLDAEARVAHPKATWPEPPDERRDSRYFVSGPDSLHLEAHVPGRQYYRFPDRPVRHGARMRLTFWYLVARGTVGETRVRLAQYKDTPTSCRVIPGGGLDQELTVVGRWTRVEKVVRIEPEATTAALDFRISSEANLGEMWIDDVSFEPVDAEALAKGP
ncbi:MAG: hypothetical protein BGO49_18700 [Planctomycetales bacterium 71-10]|nr:MAG: hypothetical protein BGO49_18700 [Planctomycetales bacterium 71-10]